MLKWMQDAIRRTSAIRESAADCPICVRTRSNTRQKSTAQMKMINWLRSADHRSQGERMIWLYGRLSIQTTLTVKNRGLNASEHAGPGQSGWMITASQNIEQHNPEPFNFDRRWQAPAAAAMMKVRLIMASCCICT